jgi:hypothetical protein
MSKCQTKQHVAEAATLTIVHFVARAARAYLDRGIGVNDVHGNPTGGTRVSGGGNAGCRDVAPAAGFALFSPRGFRQ